MARTRRGSQQTVALIAALLEAPQKWRHGYDLSQSTGVKSGTLYPILMRLDGRKLLESTWEEAPKEWRPPRHLYRLTAAGIRWARQQQLDEPDNAAARAAPSRA